MKITETNYRLLKKRLNDINEELEESLELQRTAAEAGDLSENEEYATSRAASERLLREKAKLLETLDDATIVRDDNSRRITLGSLVEIYKVDEKGRAISDKRIVRVDSAGDTILRGVLGIQSLLGKTILNGTDGIYKVQAKNGLIRYSVRKVFNNA